MHLDVVLLVSRQKSFRGKVPVCENGSLIKVPVRSVHVGTLEQAESSSTTAYMAIIL